MEPLQSAGTPILLSRIETRRSGKSDFLVALRIRGEGGTRVYTPPPRIPTVYTPPSLRFQFSNFQTVMTLQTPQAMKITQLSQFQQYSVVKDRSRCRGLLGGILEAKSCYPSGAWASWIIMRKRANQRKFRCRSGSLLMAIWQQIALPVSAATWRPAPRGTLLGTAGCLCGQPEI